MLVYKNQKKSLKGKDRSCENMIVSILKINYMFVYATRIT